MIPVNGRIRPFYRVAEDLPIAIRDITTYSYYMIAKDINAEILLGCIWLKDTMVSISEKLDRSVEASIFSEDRSRKLTFTIYSLDERTSV